MTSQYLMAIADDCEDDRFFLTRVLEEHPALKLVACLTNAEETIAYLNGSGLYQDRKKYPLADILLLDINMPLGGGFAVLKWLREHPVPKLLVEMLSDSLRIRDRDEACRLGAHSYHVKPTNAGNYPDVLRDVESEARQARKMASRHREYRARP